MNSFLKAFPSVDKRYEAALQLADPNEQKLPDASHPSWDFMAAHWGDPEEELKALGEFAWNLYGELPAEGPIAILTRGQSSELLAPKPELDDDITLMCGRITSRELIYGFGGYLTNKGPSRLGVGPPYLAFGLQLRLSHVVEIAAGILGDCSATKHDATKNVSIYFGVVTLLRDPQLYHPSRKVIKRDVLIGREACSRADEAIRAKTDATAELSIAA